MTDLVEALRLEGDRRVCEKEMTFGNSKSREDRIADDLCHQAASRISQQDAELERLRRELADVRDNLAEAEKDTHYWRVEYDKARKAAFREAGQKALEWAAHYSPASDGRNTFVLFYEWAEAKAEETRT